MTKDKLNESILRVNRGLYKKAILDRLSIEVAAYDEQLDEVIQYTLERVVDEAAEGQHSIMINLGALVPNFHSLDEDYIFLLLGEVCYTLREVYGQDRVFFSKYYFFSIKLAYAYYSSDLLP